MKRLILLQRHKQIKIPGNNKKKDSHTRVFRAKVKWHIIYRVGSIYCVKFPLYTTINQASLAAGACRALKVTLMMLLSHKIKFSLNMNDTYVKVFGEQLQTAKHIPYVEIDK